MIKRDQIVDLLADGATDQEITKKLKISKNRLQQELGKIEEASYLWLSSIGRRGYFLKYQDTLKKLKENQQGYFKLIEKLQKETQTGHMKYAYAEIQARQALDGNLEKHWHLLDQAPMVHSFKIFVQKSIGKQSAKQNLSFSSGK